MKTARPAQAARQFLPEDHPDRQGLPTPRLARALLQALRMADGIYVGMNGAAARMAQLDSIADNLANAQTPGFKAARPSFEAFLAKGDPSHHVAHPAAVATAIDLSHGPLQQTGNPLDLVPQGDGFLGVQHGDHLAFTRNGRLTVDGSGRLLAAGLPVVDREGQPIVLPPGSTARIEPNGAVLADNQRIADLGVFVVVGPLDKVGPSLLVPTPTASYSATDEGVHPGQLEGGNASPLEAAVQLVAAQRHFESTMQALQTSKRLDERAADVGRIR